MKPSTPELMKFKRLQRRLNVGTAQVVGHLELLWIATAKNAPQGDIGRFSDEDIAIACHWEGDPSLFVKSLIECGWLDRCDEFRLVVHDWEQHAPNWIKGNLKLHGKSFCKIDKATEEVTRELTKQPTKQPAREVTKQPARDGRCEVTTSPVLSSPIQRDTSYLVPSETLDTPTGMNFDIVGGGGTWELPQSKLDEWLTTFSNLAVRHELALAAQWLRDNPSRRKTAKGIVRFLGSWLTRAQDRGRAKPGPESSGIDQAKVEAFRKSERINHLFETARGELIRMIRRSGESLSDEEIDRRCRIVAERRFDLEQQAKAGNTV